jgi:type II secretory pathway component PulF
MTNDVEQLQPLNAEIVQPGSAAANLDSLNLRIALQIAPRRWVSSLRKLVNSTEQGQSLDEAVRQHSRNMPIELRSLLEAGLKLPEPTRFLLDAIVARRDSEGVRWQLIALVIYPLAMLLFAAGICFIVTSLLHVLMTEGFSDFGLVGFDQAAAYVQDQSMALMAAIGILVWCVVVGLTLRLVGPRWAGVAVLGGLPLYGKPTRWIILNELVHRLGLASGQVNDPIMAMEATAASFQGSSNEVVANLACRRMISGVSTGSAFTQSMLSDGLCAPLLLSIDQNQNLAEGCERVAKALRRIADTRCKFLSMTMPVFVIITIATMIWGTISGYVAIMIMMMRLISSLA